MPCIRFNDVGDLFWRSFGDDAATYGALSLDFDRDGRVDLLTVGHAGLVLWLNQGERFSRRALDVRLPDGAVAMAVAAGDYDCDGDHE